MEDTSPESCQSWTRCTKSSARCIHWPNTRRCLPNQGRFRTKVGLVRWGVGWNRGDIGLVRCDVDLCCSKVRHARPRSDPPRRAVLLANLGRSNDGLCEEQVADLGGRVGGSQTAPWQASERSMRGSATLGAKMRLAVFGPSFQLQPSWAPWARESAELDHPHLCLCIGVGVSRARSLQCACLLRRLHNTKSKRFRAAPAVHFARYLEEMWVARRGGVRHHTHMSREGCVWL